MKGRLPLVLKCNEAKFRNYDVFEIVKLKFQYSTFRWVFIMSAVCVG